MNARRRALGWALATVATIGIGLAALPFVDLLRPSERAKALARQLEVKNMARGSWRTVEGRQSRLLIVRTIADAFYVYALPTKGGRVAMPDIHWWRGSFFCVRTSAPIPRHTG